MQMTTDSLYFGLSERKLEEAIKPELKEEFEMVKKQWLCLGKWSNQEPGLFKLEFDGTRRIAFCSKCYFMEDEEKAQDVLKRCEPNTEQTAMGNISSSFGGKQKSQTETFG